MEYMTISEVKKLLSTTTRTLRYYEEIGLIESRRSDDYAYRTYDSRTVRRLQSIFILRKLTIPLEKIKLILASEDAGTAVEVFREKLAGIDDEIIALETIKTIIESFVTMINKNLEIDLNAHLLSGYSFEIIDSIASRKQVNKERKAMDDLNKASKTLSKFDNIRIVYLPPATVASSHQGVCDEPEKIAGDRLLKFIQKTKLYDIKPDFRQYGFNNPCRETEHGYEFWVTIPEDMEVSAPLTKKQFEGGLYAAHCIKMGDFHEWHDFNQAIEKHDEYVIDRREPLGMGGLLEEHLNAYNHYKNDEMNFIQLDLLIPIEKKD